MAWPDIATPDSVTTKRVKGQYKSTFETGRQVSGAKHTSVRKRFTLNWNAMSQSDLEDLEDALDTDMGGTFSWTYPNPDNPAVYTVGYGVDGFSSRESVEKEGFHEVEVILEQR